MSNDVALGFWGAIKARGRLNGGLRLRRSLSPGFGLFDPLIDGAVSVLMGIFVLRVKELCIFLPLIFPSVRRRGKRHSQDNQSCDD